MYSLCKVWGDGQRRTGHTGLKFETLKDTLDGLWNLIYFEQRYYTVEFVVNVDKVLENAGREILIGGLPDVGKGLEACM